LFYCEFVFFKLQKDLLLSIIATLFESGTEVNDLSDEPEFIRTGVPPQYKDAKEAEHGAKKFWNYVKRNFGCHMKGVNNMEVEWIGVKTIISLQSFS